MFRTRIVAALATVVALAGLALAPAAGAATVTHGPPPMLHPVAEHHRSGFNSLCDWKGVTPDKCMTSSSLLGTLGSAVDGFNRDDEANQEFSVHSTSDCGSGLVSVSSECPFSDHQLNVTYSGDPIYTVNYDDASNRCAGDTTSGFVALAQCSGVTGIDYVSSGYSLINIAATNANGDGSVECYAEGGNAGDQLAISCPFVEGYDQWADVSQP
jgi:hypothetical protein